MRAVVQRVSRAKVVVAGEETGVIGPGLLVFLGVGKGDAAEDVAWLVNKVAGLRVFEDEEGRMNRSVEESGASVLLISQFTLFGNLKKGFRPSFNRAGHPQEAIPLYDAFRERLGARLGQVVPTGVFGAHMEIEAVHDGPVTLVLDTREKDF